MRMIKRPLWTSILDYPESLDVLLGEFIASISNKIRFDQNTKTTVIYDSIPFSPCFGWRGGGEVDHTCIAKGWFIKKFLSYVETKLGDLPANFFINFGGDIYTKNSKMEINVDSKYHKNIKFLLHKEGMVFCSTNRERKGHIPDALHDVSYSFSELDPVLGDKYATVGLISKEVNEKALIVDNDLIINKTYIASPFFCSTDVEIRDRMLLGFSNYVRPDLLNPNIEGDLHKDKILAQKIKDDNLHAIDECNVLVFPKNTVDLGTLFEVGYAIRKGKLIIRYDYVTDIYEVLVNPSIPVKLPEDVILDLNKLGSGILLGYHYDKPLKYFLGSSRDNIMLMNNILIEKPNILYPCYLPNILSDSVYRLNTLTSGS